MISFFSTIIGINKNIVLNLLISGQSNGVGTSEDGLLASQYLRDPIQNALIYDGVNWSTLEYNVNNKGNDAGTNRYGSELSFAFNWVDKVGKVNIEKYAVGATGIAQDGTKDDFNVNSNELFPNLKSAYQNLVNYSNNTKQDNETHIFVYYPFFGERDAVLNNGNEFDTNFIDMVNELETIKSFHHIFINQLSSNAITTGYAPAINVNRVRNAADRLKIHFGNKGILTDMTQYGFHDAIHFSAINYEKIGNDLSDKLIQTIF